RSQLELVVQLVRQGQGVALVRFQEACRATLYLQDVDGNIQVLQVLLQGTMVVPGALQQDEDLFERAVGADPLKEQAKALARILDPERGTGFDPLGPLQQGSGEKARHMPSLAHVDANIEGLTAQQRRWGMGRMSRS